MIPTIANLAGSRRARRRWSFCRRTGDQVVSDVTCFVIPGCASWRRPGIHTPGRGYGFRAHRCAMPRNDGFGPITSAAAQTARSIGVRRKKFSVEQACAKDKIVEPIQQIHPTGKSPPKPCPALRAKIFRFRRRGWARILIMGLGWLGVSHLRAIARC